MRLTLHFQNGTTEPQTFTARERRVIAFGRGPGVDVVIPHADRQVSRQHFLVEISPTACRLVLYPNARHVLVNHRPTREVDLNDGDIVQISGIVIRIELDPTALPAPVEPKEPPALEAILEWQSDRWDAGQRWIVEQVLQRWPSLAANHAMMIQLIYHEFLLRLATEPQLDEAEYIRRFPQLEAIIRPRFRCHFLFYSDRSLFSAGDDTSP